MTERSRDFEDYFIPRQSFDLEVYLELHQDVDPATVLSLLHIPQIFGDQKSHARNDDRQYDMALFETQRLLSDASGCGMDVKTLFVPGAVDHRALDYFRQLARLAQDTGIIVVTRIADDDNIALAPPSFKRFDPPSAPSAADYWEQCSERRGKDRNTLPCHHIIPTHHSLYTLDGVRVFDHPPAPRILANIAPLSRPPFVFTAFEQLQLECQNRLIGDPAWDMNEYELVSNIEEYERVNRAHKKSRSNLLTSLHDAARLDTAELQQLLLGDKAPFADKVPILRELAVYSSDYTKTDHAIMARTILAKLGDKPSAQLILREIQDEAKTIYNDSFTAVPLGIHLRHDAQLFDSVVADVKNSIADGAKGSRRLVSLLAALYNSHDARLGAMFANHLVVPDSNVEAYTRTVLYAARQWLPEYVYALALQPQSYSRDQALRAIESQTATFMDAYSRGELECLKRFGAPDYLLPMLFWFNNPAHQPILARILVKQFEEGGFIVTDRRFERTYLSYRMFYGDLPEISRHIHIRPEVPAI